MESPIVRYSFPLVWIHWLLLAATVFAVLGLGWFLHSFSPTAPERAFYLDLHISLGLTSFVLAGVLGMLVSFAGITTSITLLITKTISQPPGIAITKPTTIIRALDVFILLVNFTLLIAHFVGTTASLWLNHRVTQCRHEYLKLSRCNPVFSPKGDANYVLNN